MNNFGALTINSRKGKKLNFFTLAMLKINIIINYKCFLSIINGKDSLVPIIHMGRLEQSE